MGGRDGRGNRGRREVHAHRPGPGMAGPSFSRGEAEPLFAVLQAHEGGDDGPMDRWDRETKPKWLRIQRRWVPPWVDEERSGRRRAKQLCSCGATLRPSVRRRGGVLPEPRGSE